MPGSALSPPELVGREGDERDLGAREYGRAIVTAGVLMALGIVGRPIRSAPAPPQGPGRPWTGFTRRSGS